MPRAGEIYPSEFRNHEKASTQFFLLKLSLKNLKLKKNCEEENLRGKSASFTFLAFMNFSVSMKRSFFYRKGQFNGILLVFVGESPF